MQTEPNKFVKELTQEKYKYGFTTEVSTDIIEKGLNEDVIRLISSKKGEPEWMLEFRLNAYRHWLTMTMPHWAHLDIPEIDYQAISYYADPTKKKEGPKSMDEVDPELIKTFNKLGIPLHEQRQLSGMAVDAVMDSVSVKTTFKETLMEKGIIFCSFSEAVKEHPDLVQKYLGSVVGYRDNFFAALNSAVFSDGSFVYIPKGVRCPMELSTYFRINAANTGQFERTLIVADDDAYVSYLEGCTAPMRDENQLHAAIVEIVANDRSEVKYSTVQNWYPGDKNGNGGIYNFVFTEELNNIIINNKAVLITLVETLNTAANIKMIILEGLNKSPANFKSFLRRKSTGDYIDSTGEGISMSDLDGNIVKLVDRSSFSNANRDPDFESGFDHNLQEDANSDTTVAVAFGRFNPCTIGHLKLINKLASIDADENRLYLSHTQDKKKNPLTYEQKLRYCDLAFGNKVQVTPSDAKTIFN